MLMSSRGRFFSASQNNVRVAMSVVKTARVEPRPLPELTPEAIRGIREHLDVSRVVVGTEGHGRMGVPNGSATFDRRLPVPGVRRPRLGIVVRPVPGARAYCPAGLGMRYPTPRRLNIQVGLRAFSPSFARSFLTKLRTRLTLAASLPPQTLRSRAS